MKLGLVIHSINPEALWSGFRLGWLRQGGFPALARPDQGDGRVTLKVQSQPRFYGSRQPPPSA